MKRPIAQRGFLLVLLSVACLPVLAGCLKVGPDYKPPETRTPARWSAQLRGGLTDAPADTGRLEAWWTVFHDPLLCDLVDEARAGNLDLRRAGARLREARAERGMVRADLFPSVAADASAARTAASDDTGGGRTGDLFSAGFDAAWEPDIFGGKRRAVESATASLQAAEEALGDVLVSLLAEVALNYVEVRSNQELLGITESGVAARRETHAIASWRREAGLTTQLDVDQARLSLEQARAQIPVLWTSLQQASNRLAVLLGLPPGALDGRLADTAPVPVVPASVAVGLPADLVRRRPDVRQAERELAAQTAQIGVARAELYPDFTLLGSVGLESFLFPGLFSAGALAAQGLAGAGWTLFDGGKIRQNIRVQTARQDEALSRYEGVVLAALQEVEDTLVAFASEQTRRQTLADACSAGRSAFGLARDQYASGLVSFQSVVDTQQSLLSVQDLLAVSNARVSAHLIRLYKALGGGWAPAAASGAPPLPNTGSQRTP